MQRHSQSVRYFSAAIFVFTAVSVWAAGSEGETRATRYLGSPSGEYKLTIETTGDTTQAILKRLIIPNQTLWQKDLSYLSAGHAGFIGDNGTVVLLNLSDAGFAGRAVTIFRPDGSVLEEYTTDDLAQTLKTSSPTNTGVNPDQIKPSSEPFLKYGRVVVPMEDVQLLIDISTGALTTRLETRQQ